MTEQEIAAKHEAMIIAHMDRVQAEIRRLENHGLACVICGEDVPPTLNVRARKTCRRGPCVRENRARMSRAQNRRKYVPKEPRRVECDGCGEVFFTRHGRKLRCEPCAEKWAREYYKRKLVEGAA